MEDRGKATDVGWSRRCSSLSLSLSLPWCKCRCSSPEYRWHYTSNPLNGWDTLTCWCLEWPASISSAFAMPNTFVNVIAKSLSLGYGSEDISYNLFLTFSSPVNVLHWFFYCLRCQWEVGTSTNLCRKLEQLSKLPDSSVHRTINA